MNTENSFSSLSMSEKRKRLMAMVDMRKKLERKKAERPVSMLENEEKINSKKPFNGSKKRKKLNAHTYKKMFRNAGPKRHKNMFQNDIRKDEQGPNKCTEEYWVPVHLSRMQMEQYCSLLHSNFEALSSSLRNYSSLHDILTETRKCCDHPYLVNRNLRESLKTNTPIDQLNAEINASGKLQLLDKLLLEIKRCGLRVLVLFQSVGSSKQVSIGDILDDLVDQRFGHNSYVRIHGKIIANSDRVKRKDDLKIFNNLDNGKFVCLMDYRACHSTIKISSVDVAILYNSDWNPSNDVKALHKITLDSRERLRVLRLYSSFTIEEKALIISKQGAIFDNNSSRINYSNCHRLLAWGVSYLLSNLSKDPSSESNSMSKSNNDLVHELSSLLMNKNGNTNRLKNSVTSNAQLCDGVYSTSNLLLGETESRKSCSNEEYLMQKGPLEFWSKLFKENPWKNSSSRLSRRVQKSTRNPNYWVEGYETEKETDTENFHNDATNSPSVRKRLRSRRRACTEVEQGTNTAAECTINQPPQPQTSPVVLPVSDQSSNASPLETELENIKKEREEVTKLHQEKKSMLISQCEKEILEIRKKYDALIDESEMCLTNKTKVLEDYYDLVYANKVLAETLAKTCDDTLNEEKTDKETSSVRIVEIPASALVQSENRRTTSNPSGHNLRAPAPHLRSSPSLFASTPQTRTELNNMNNQENTKKQSVFQSAHSLPELFVEFDDFYDMGCPKIRRNL
ncbi:hypothetical protein L2E82_28323 [Cichorium intybus]|uniref:Uncharacterized protein n=1 Tax=Cichorium intybus TaxID=13427 RepID=A0ACB9CVE9_CICIN|nr:hypothetical protein L2E82_28323 [Cichorium intybus]